MLEFCDDLTDGGHRIRQQTKLQMKSLYEASAAALFFVAGTRPEGGIPAWRASGVGRLKALCGACDGKPYVAVWLTEGCAWGIIRPLRGRDPGLAVPWRGRMRQALLIRTRARPRPASTGDCTGSAGRVTPPCGRQRRPRLLEAQPSLKRRELSGPFCASWPEGPPPPRPSERPSPARAQS